MSEITQTVRFASDRQLIVTEQVKRIFLFGNTTVGGTYKNITAGLETVKMGQVMGGTGQGIKDLGLFQDVLSAGA